MSAAHNRQHRENRRNREVLRWSVAAFLVVALGVTTAVVVVSAGGTVSDPPSEDRQYALDELEEDYGRAVQTVTERHPLLYADQEELKRIVEEQYKLLRDGMTGVEFYRVLAPVIEALACGHSNLQMDKDYERYLWEYGALLPLAVRVVDGELVVTGTATPGGTDDGAGAGAPAYGVDATAEIPIGSVIVSINGQPGEAILSEMLSQIPSDGHNRVGKITRIGSQFAHFYHLLVDDSRKFDLVYRPPGPSGPSGTRTVTLQGVPSSALFPDSAVLSSIGLYLDMEEMRRPRQTAIHGDYAYLDVRSFLIGRRDFAETLEEFFPELERRNTPRLVVDLRGNWGGPPRSAALLLSYLIDEPVVYFDSNVPFYMRRYTRPLDPAEHRFTGDITILIDGTVFSTAAHLVSLLRMHEVGEIVGEATGGAAACTDGSRSIRLKHTGVRVFYATTVFSTTAPWSVDTPSIEPDRPIPRTIEEVITGRDPVMEYATRG